MGCFVSCFRSKDRERRIQLRSRARSNSDSHCVQQGLKEQFVVEEELGSLSLNGENDIEKKIVRPLSSDKQLMQEACLKTSNLDSFCEETPMEICQLNKRTALQELNGSDQSSKSAHTLFNKKIQLVVQCEQESSPDQAITSTPSLEKENSASSQNTPGTGSSEETRACKLDLTQVRNGIGVPVLDPNLPYPTAMTLNGEMQTPATVYSSYKDTPMTGKQVYAALETTHQVEISSGIESVELEKENEVARECFSHTKKCSEDTPKVVVPAISPCLNGIPNTTTKYKEDQRVKWHATPFEERLERILSDEKMPPPRTLISGRLIQLEE